MFERFGVENFLLELVKWDALNLKNDVNIYDINHLRFGKQ